MSAKSKPGYQSTTLYQHQSTLRLTLEALGITQFPGAAAMGISVLIFFLLPWLVKGAVKSIRYRGSLYKSWLAVFVVCFLVLGYLGTVPVTVWGQFTGGWASALDTTDRATWVARILTLIYFLFFLLMPWYTARDKTKPVPDRVR